MIVAVLNRIDSKGEFEPVARIVIPTQDWPISHGTRYTLFINNKKMPVLAFDGDEDVITIVSLSNYDEELPKANLEEAYIEEIYDFDLLKELLG